MTYALLLLLALSCVAFARYLWRDGDVSVLTSLAALPATLILALPVRLWGRWTEPTPTPFPRRGPTAGRLREARIQPDGSCVYEDLKL